MQNAYVVNGRITDEGLIILDELPPLAAGPVVVTILPANHISAQVRYTPEEYSELWTQIDRIGAQEGPLPPDDGLSARDADSILYGSNPQANDVR
jgi:hypothetical protein